MELDPKGKKDRKEIRKNMQRNNNQKFSKIYENHKCTDTKISMNLKHKRHEKPKRIIKLHQNIKCLGINLTKYTQNSYMEN